MKDMLECFLKIEHAMLLQRAASFRAIEREVNEEFPLKTLFVVDMPKPYSRREEDKE
jgi:hypothetical protein